MWDIRNLALVLLVGMILYLGFCSSPTVDPYVIQQTDTVYVEHPLSQSDTSGADIPSRVTIYPESENTVDVEIRVPERFLDEVEDTTSISSKYVPKFMGIDRSSVHVSHNTVDVFAYDFEFDRNIRMTFAVPERNWDWGLDFVSSYHGPEMLFLGMDGRLSYKQTEISVGPSLNPVTGDVGLKFGLRINIRSR